MVGKFSPNSEAHLSWNSQGVQVRVVVENHQHREHGSQETENSTINSRRANKERNGWEPIWTLVR